MECDEFIFLHFNFSCYTYIFTFSYACHVSYTIAEMSLSSSTSANTPSINTTRLKIIHPSTALLHLLPMPLIQPLNENIKNCYKL